MLFNEDNSTKGAHLLSGSVLILGSKGRWFEIHFKHCICPLLRHSILCLELGKPRKSGKRLTENSLTVT